MPVVQLPPDVLRVGEATLFALRDRAGCLLVPRGTLVATEEQRQLLTARELYVDEQDNELLKRALAGKLDGMLRRGALLGHLAQARPDATDLPLAANAVHTPGRRLADPVGTWSSLQLRAGAVLRDPAAADFASKIEQLQLSLLDQLNSDADDALFLLVHGATQEFRDYSVSHSLLVAVVCELAARQHSPWNAEWRTTLRRAALTMNIAMTTLQNQLAVQDGAPSAEQRAQITNHAERGVALLRAAGITDERWLAAVAQHHRAPAGPMDALPAEVQMARLIQRADIFAARMSPRRKRAAMSATAAAKAAYLDENQQPDPAGSLIIKATGLYPPGCLVKLRSGETAVVLRRGRRANHPEVASILKADGLALAEPVARNTRLAANEVVGGVAPHEVKVRLNPERLLRLL
jgi:HD-GYP domain-containing protein (c-di-GMP phosphodiesterase class II)